MFPKLPLVWAWAVQLAEWAAMLIPLARAVASLFLSILTHAVTSAAGKPQSESPR